MYWSNTNELALIGAKVETVLEEGDAGITLHTDKGVFTVRCSGECCSNSWYEHLGDKSLLEGYRITGVGTVERGDLEDVKTIMRDVTDMEYVKQYAVQIHSTKGTYEMEMRNNSNGYYGGTAEIHKVN